uniref:rho GTPase-activating protein 15-like n=1 Tax=Centroberyx gerrardi TaxID=166262 RepID=UPI003AAF6B68
DHSALGPDLPVYANVTSLKKPSVPQLSVSAPSFPCPSVPAPSHPDPAHSPPGHTPSSSVSSSGLLSPASPLSPQGGWQVHTDRDSGKVFYYHPVTRQTTWSDPRSPPTPLSGEMDQSRGREGLLASPSPLLSPASSQGSCGWEQLLDEASGRPYYYNPSSGATSWAAPEPLSPSSPSSPASPASGAEADGGGRRQEHGPPPLPEEDYPVDDQSETDAPVFTPQAQRVGPVRAAGWSCSTDTDGKTVYSSAQSQEQWVRSEDDKGKTYYYLRDGTRSQWRLPKLPAAPGSQPPQRLMGNGVDEEGATLQVRNWRHSMAEDRFVPSHRRNVSDSSSGNSPETTHPDRFRLRRNLSNQSTESHQLHGHLLEKAGILNKTKVVDNGKRIRKNWGQSWTVLHGGILTFHKDPKSAPTGNSSKTTQIVPEYTVELRGASLSWASKDKSSKKNVIELKTRQGCEYLVQYDTESIICDWHKVILDTIRQLEQDHLSEEEEDEASDKEDKERKRSSTRSSSGPAESDQGRVRKKLRKFLQRRPTLQSVKEKGYIRDNVFGCHLDTLCHRENTTVPRFVEKCIRAVERRGLDVDGIYRVSGNLAVIQKLRHKADHEEQLDLEDGQWEEIHVIAGALKLFLRELPEPLFPFSSFSKFIAAIQVPDYSQRVSYMKDLVRSLPLPNHDTMELLFRHLRKVIEHGESNRMSVQSVAIVFGPTLLRPQTESANLTVHMVFQNQIVELILNEFLTVFSQR